MKANRNASDHSFVETITANSQTFIILFVFQASLDQYEISFRNFRNVPPFTVKETQSGVWKIVGK